MDLILSCIYLESDAATNGGQNGSNKFNIVVNLQPEQHQKIGDLRTLVEEKVEQRSSGLSLFYLFIYSGLAVVCKLQG